MKNRQQLLEQKYGEGYKWVAMLGVIIGLLATIFSSTMINVALTNIMATFDITQASAQWMSTGFFCASTVCMLAAAWALQNYGARKTFMAATILFFIGSFLGQFALSFDLLILARVLQGAGAGMLQPLSMALIFILFPPEKRGSAMGTFAMIVVLGPAVGPTIGGVITDVFDWHYTFTAGLPLSFIAGVLGWVFLPDRTETGRKSRFNFVSFLLIAVTISSFLTGLSNSQFYDFSNAKVLVFLGIALAGIILFIQRERKSAAPLLQIDLFRNLYFTSTVIIGAITSAGMFSSIYMLPLFARTVLQTTATDAGLLLLPGGLALAAVSPIVGRLIDKMPPHRILLTGILLFVVSSYALTYADQYSSFWMIAGWIVVSRIALGFILPSNSTLSLSSVKPSEVPQASGALNFCRMLGATTGVNLIAVIITARSAYHHASLLEEVDSGGLTDEITIQALAYTFQDGFLIGSIFVSLALFPAAYIILNGKK
ncbi:MAG: MFS transporter [Sneathiella sp.]|nr:MAG: MFS transporter [Sneathiella sp.]